MSIRLSRSLGRRYVTLLAPDALLWVPFVVVLVVVLLVLLVGFVGCVLFGVLG